MSPMAESRVVQISFDNEDFEKNVKQSLDTLTKLNSALEFKDGSKGLDNISKASKNLDMSGISDSVSNASRHFSTLEIVGVTALANLANSAVNVGKKIVSSVIQPLTSGGFQRALNMEQAKFMLNGLLGEEAKKAIGSVGELGSIMDNIYKSVDGTIYSLDKAALVAARLMASGIVGTGENAELTKILQAVAGVSSVFSADYERVGDLFSTIKSTGALMGQQVLSFTTMGVPLYAKLAEYLSKIVKEGTQAGKSLSEIFPNNEKLVKALGELDDATNVTEADLKDMIGKGAIDFKLFSDAMYDAFGSQASKSKEMYIGALEDMKAAAARIGEKFMKPFIGDSTAGIPGVLRDILNASVPLLDSIGNRLGREGGVIETFSNLVQNAGKKIILVMDLISAAFDQDETEAQLKRLVDNGLADPSRLKNLEKFAYQIQRIREVFESIGTLISSVFGIIGAGFSVAKNILAFFAGIAESILIVIAGAQSPLKALRKNVKAWGKDLGSFIATITKIIMNSELLKGILEILQKVFGDFGNIVKHTGDNLVDLAKSASKVIQILGKGVAKTIASIIKELKGLVSISDIVNTGILATLMVKVGKVFEFLKGEGMAFGAIFGDIQKRFGGGILNNLRKSSALFADSLDQLRLALNAYQKSIKASVLLKIAAGLLAIAIAIKILSGIDTKSLIRSVAAIGVLGVMLNLFLKGTLSVIKAAKKLSVRELAAFALVGGYLRSMALALIGMALAVKILGSMDSDAALTGILSLIAIAGVMYVLFKSMSKVTKAEGAAGIGRVLVIALAIDMMALAFIGLGKLSLDQLNTAAMAMSILAGIIIALQYAMSKISKVQNVASILPLIGVAVSLGLLANTFRKLGMMDYGQIEKATVAMLVCLGSILLVFEFLNNTKMNAFAASIALGRIAGTVQTIFKVFLGLAEMDYEQIKRAATGLAVIEAAVVGMFAVLSLLTGSEGKFGSNEIAQSLISALLLTVVSKTIFTMAKAFINLGKMSWESIGNAAVGMGLILACILAMVGISKLVSNIGVGEDLLMFAGTLILLGAGFKVFAYGVQAMGGMDLKTLAIGIGAVAAAILVLNGVAKIVEETFEAFLKMTAGMAAFGLGLAAIGAGAFVLGFGLASLAGSLKQLTTEDVVRIMILVGAMALLSPIVKDVGVSFLLFGAGVAMVGVGLIAVGVGIAAIGLGFKVLASSAESAVGAINSFANLDFSAVFKLAGLVTIFGLLSPLVLAFGLGLIVAGAGMAALGGGVKVVLSALQGIKKVIDHLFDGLGDKLVSMCHSAVSSLKKIVPQTKDVVKNLNDIVKQIKKAVKNISDTYKDAYRAGKHVVEGITNGINGNKSTAINAANQLARETLAAYKKEMGISSPSKKMAELARWGVLGFVRGMNDNTPLATDSMATFATAVMNAYEYVSDNTDLAPTITPVVDTSNVERAVGSINSMMNMRSALGVSANMAYSKSPGEKFIDRLADAINSTNSTSNSQMNNYITVDGASDPSAFADELVRSFRLNARMA